MNIRELIHSAIAEHSRETSRLHFLPENRYNSQMFASGLFASCGWYDWFSGQMLYCLTRYLKPRRVLEVSTASGYATLFIALAMKENNVGLVETYEWDAVAANAAKRNLVEQGVSPFVRVHEGDARILLANPDSDFDIYFLDSMHIAHFAKWFVEKCVLSSSSDDALFHMHDITECVKGFWTLMAKV